MTSHWTAAENAAMLSASGENPPVGSVVKPCATAFSAAVQWLVIPFIFVAGVNFALFWGLLSGEVRELSHNTEFRRYAGAIATLTAVLAALLYSGSAPVLDLGGATAGAPENSLRQATFQIVSLLNSTGYATSNFAHWGSDARIVLLFAMLIEGSAGSTGGGIKVVR